MVKRNLIANFIGQSWSLLMHFAFVPVYIKYLGMEAYGLIGFYLMLQTWLTLLDIGMTQTLSREMARYTSGVHTSYSIHDLLRTVEFIGFGIALIVALVIAFGSEWIVDNWLQFESLPTNEVKEVFFYIGIIIALRFVEGIYRGSLIGLQRQVILNWILSTIATLRGLGAALVLIFLSPSINAFFLWQVLMSLILISILAVTTYLNLGRINRVAKFSRKAFLKIWRFAGGVFLISIIGLMNSQVDKVVISKYVSMSQFGEYTLAVAIAGIIFVFITPIIQAFYPKFIEHHARSDFSAINKSFHEGSQIVTLVASTFSIMLIFFSENFLVVWLENPILVKDIQNFIIILLVGNLFNTFLYIPMQVVLAFGSPSYGAIMGFVSALITIISMLYFVPIYGLLGAVCVWSTVRFSTFVVAPYFIFRKFLVGQNFEWYVKDVIIPFLIILVTISGAKSLLSYFGTMSIYAEGFLAITLMTLTFIIGIIFSSRLRHYAIINARILIKRISLYEKN